MRRNKLVVKRAEGSDSAFSNRVQTVAAIVGAVAAIFASLWYANDLLRVRDDALVDQETIDVMEEIVDKHKDRLEQ